MPYKLSGKKILHKKGGKWKVKQTSKTVASAKRALRLLRGLESGSIKPEQVGKEKFAKKKSRKVGRGKGLKQWRV
jgi:hypothetical protein